MSNKSVTSNLFWRFCERIGAHSVKLIVEIVLARILLPNDYGLIALVTVFITVLQVFVDSGLANSLIQKKDADELDFSSVFWFNLGWCCVLYVLFFLASPIIALFFGKSELTSVLRVLGLQVIISGIKNVQQAYVSRNMQFKKFFYATMAGTVVAAIVGIVLALNGFGVWALVAQHLVNSSVDTIVLWFVVKWRPKKMFSFSRLRLLISYGWKLLVSSLINVFYNEIRQLVIGKIYSSSDLAFYNRGRQFPEFIVGNINSSMDSVLFPTMSKEQDNKDRIRAMTRRTIKASSYVMMPLMFGLSACAEPIIQVLLTEKWLSCVFFLRVFCFTYAFYPIHTANLNAIKAMGRSDLFLKLEIIKKVFGLVALVSTMFISVEAMAISTIITSVVSQIINSWPNRKLLGYRYVDQLKDIFPQIALSIVMGLIVYSISYIGLSEWLTLLIQVPLGACIYVVGSVFLRIDSFDFIGSILKEYVKKKG